MPAVEMVCVDESTPLVACPPCSVGREPGIHDCHVNYTVMLLAVLGWGGASGSGLYTAPHPLCDCDLRPAPLPSLKLEESSWASGSFCEAERASCILCCVWSLCDNGAPLFSLMLGSDSPFCHFPDLLTPPPPAPEDF